MSIKINSNRCVGCGRCIEVCPGNLIKRNIEETLSAVSSERTTRVIDHEEAGSMERRKMEGYF